MFESSDIILRRSSIAGVLLLCIVPFPFAMAQTESIDTTRQGADRISLAIESGMLSGQFAERTPGNFVFIPSAGDLPALPVLNPGQVSPASVGLRLMVRGEYDNSRRGGLVIENFRLDSSFDPLSMDISRAQQFPGNNADIANALSLFSTELNRSLQPGAMSADLISPDSDSSLSRAADQAELQLRQVYTQAVLEENVEDRTASVRAIASLRQQLKSIYGSFDNYAPWSYQRIHSNSKGVVAIAEENQLERALCSGVLIAHDLVLTAGHCFARNHPEDLQVLFGFTEGDAGVLSTPIGANITELVAPATNEHDEFLDRAADQFFDSDMPDFAIVRIDREVEVPPDVVPQCFRRSHSKRDRSLYVIGYPRGQRAMVHDNARVYLPFQQRFSRFNRLKQEIEVDFSTLEYDLRIELIKEFTDSYVLVGEGNNRMYELRDVRFGNQPKLGIVADTFSGNSGSPVYDRNNHCIVGILTAGAPDTGVRLGASWLLHETVLPFPAIVEKLAENELTASLLADNQVDLRP